MQVATEVGRPAEVKQAVREIIGSIKDVDPSLIGDDQPLFRDDPGVRPEIEMDSLDALDLALSLKERFDPDGEELESLLARDLDPATLGTVNLITEFILSADLRGQSQASGDQPSFS